MVSCSDYAICSSLDTLEIIGILLDLVDIEGSKVVVLVCFLSLEEVVLRLLNSEVVAVDAIVLLVAFRQSFKKILIVFMAFLDGLGFSEFVFPFLSDTLLFFTGLSVRSLECFNFTSILLLARFALGVVAAVGLVTEVGEIECSSRG